MTVILGVVGAWVPCRLSFPYAAVTLFVTVRGNLLLAVKVISVIMFKS